MREGEDCYIVSYPKSGNTWVRFLIGSLVTNNAVDFKSVKKIIPDIYQTRASELEAMPSPRYIKSHEAYTASYGKVLYILRDGRDVAVSYYYHLKKANAVSTGFSAYLESFVAQQDQFGGWQQNAGSWHEKLGASDKFLLIKYEDLITDAYAEMVKITDFLGIKRSREEIEKAVANSSFTKMSEIERAQETELDELKHTNMEIKFVRKGQAGDWKTTFSDQDKDLFKNSPFGEALIRFGYETDRDW